MRTRISNLRALLYILLVFPFIEPQYIQSNLSLLHYAYVLLRAVDVTIIVMNVVAHYKIYTPSKSLKIILIYNLWLLINTFIHGGSVLYALTSVLSSVILCLIIDYYLRKDTTGIINGLAIVLEAYVLINFICILLYPNGMYKSLNPALGYVSSNWFLGYKNPQIRVILPAVATVLIRNYIKNEFLNICSIMFLLIGILSAIFVDSGTATLGIIIFAAAIFYFNTFNESRVLSIRNIAILAIMVLIGILAFNFQEYFSSFFENILQRDVTLTGRTIIWVRYLDYMGRQHYLGSGIMESSEMFRLFGTSHPHNYFLYILLQGGILGMLIIIYLILTVSKKQKKHLYSNTSHVLICCIAAFLIMGLTESLTECVMLYPLFVLAGNIDYLQEAENKREHKQTLFGLLLPNLRKKNKGDINDRNCNSI